MTTNTISDLKEKANESFLAGEWQESENYYKKALLEIDSSDKNVENRESIELMMDYSNLLSLKERNDDCKEICLNILEKLDRNFSEDKDSYLKTLLKLAESLSFYGETESSLIHLEKAKSIAGSRKNPDDDLRATILATYAAFILSNEGHNRFSEVESLIAEAENVLKSSGITSGEALANVLSTKAIFIQLKGELEESQKLYLEALSAIEEHPLSPSFGESCFGYATLRATDSRFSESLSFLEENIQSKEKSIGKNHPILKRAISALALTYSACGELDEAEAQAQRYNQIVEMMGNPGGELKIDCLRILIDILEQQSRFSEAQALLTRANDIAESIGNESTQVQLKMDLARLKLDLGDFQESVRLYENALELTIRNRGENHFETAICLGVLGNAYFANHDYDKAESAIRKSILLSSQQEEFFSNLLGADNYRYLGLICLQQNKLEEAEDSFLKALSFLETTKMEETLQACETLRNMGELYEVKEEFNLAKLNYQRALDLARKILGDNNFEVADYMSYLADISRKQESTNEAEELYNKALTVYEDTVGPIHPRTCTLLQRLGEFYIEQENFDNAEEYFSKALTRMEQTLGTNHPDVGYTSYCLGATYHWKEQPGKAEKYYRKALSIKETQLGKTHKELAKIVEPLIDVLQSQGKHDEAHSLNRRMIEITGYDSNH